MKILLSTLAFIIVSVGSIGVLRAQSLTQPTLVRPDSCQKVYVDPNCTLTLPTPEPTPVPTPTTPQVMSSPVLAPEPATGGK